MIAVGFSGDGDKLATVSTDNDHTVTVWDWKKEETLCSGKCAQGVPTMVFGCVWNIFAGQEGAHSCDLCTFGVKHIPG